MTAKAKLAPAPRRLTVEWQRDDIVQVGSTRWAIRTLRADGHVELEAMNVSPGIWWTTILDKLPDPTEQRGGTR